MIEDKVDFAENLQEMIAFLLENGVPGFPELGRDGECRVAMGEEMAIRMLEGAGPFDWVLAHFSLYTAGILSALRQGAFEGPTGTSAQVPMGVHSGHYFVEEKVRSQGFDFFLGLPIEVEKLFSLLRGAVGGGDGAAASPRSPERPRAGLS